MSKLLLLMEKNEYEVDLLRGGVIQKVVPYTDKSYDGVERFSIVKLTKEDDKENNPLYEETTFNFEGKVKVFNFKTLPELITYMKGDISDFIILFYNSMRLNNKLRREFNGEKEYRNILFFFDNDERDVICGYRDELKDNLMFPFEVGLLYSPLEQNKRGITSSIGVLHNGVFYTLNIFSDETVSLVINDIILKNKEIATYKSQTDGKLFMSNIACSDLDTTLKSLKMKGKEELDSFLTEGYRYFDNDFYV